MCVFLYKKGEKMSLEGYAENEQNLKGKLEKIPSVDRTLTVDGDCADAKVVGDKLRAMDLRIDDIDPHFAKNVNFDNTNLEEIDAEDVQSAIEQLPSVNYRMVNGEKEWLNPPMNGWEEYRTAERWMGKPVYTKLASYCPPHDVGNSSGVYGFSFEFSTPNFFQLVRYAGTLGSSANNPIPCFNSAGGFIGVNYMNSGGAAIAMNKKLIPADEVLYIQLWYTKS